ncbi:GPH family glycoside/pentoside/hexuronide:cation symporter [Kushneria sinocarnis]|uniref:GPH family glycoside/pentoside/hexuronide:cation symporter n=1 Tax=Kushneria sinocarnis TaxID=595502 RepID=A0A420X1D0_9GAMM|nr:MFS transporter [Kushneria sinocarnis]RKR07651.1 GPH family glycoside/pentoside/hexuronide:cation symporter [Kushneria sinocarnis]
MLGARGKLSYGLGDFASAFTWASLSLYLMYFYTDVFGLSPALVGTLFLITRFWDAITDPLVGWLADRTHTRLGRLRPYILYFSLPLAVLLALTFMTPPFGDTGRVVYAFATYMLLMGLYTLVNVPYSALPVAMTIDNRERRQLTNARMLCSYVGFVIISYSTLPLVEWLGGGDDQRGFALTYALYGAVTFLVFMLTFRGVRERHTQGEEERNPLRTFGHVARAKPFWIMFAASLLIFALMLMPDSAAIYFFKYYIGNEELVSWFLASGYIGVVVGILFNQFCLQRFCKRRIIIVGNLAYALALALFFLAADWGAPAYFAAFFAAKFLNGVITPNMWAMVADIADYVEYRSGRKATGASTSAVTFSQKFGMSIGGMLTGLLFSLAGYTPNTEQGDLVLTLIKSMMSVLPAVGALGVVLLMWLHPLSDRRMEQIRAAKPTSH